jgi:hypothetical protein
LAQIATYLSHGTLTGTPSTVQEFRDELKKFGRDPIVYLCSAINILLGSWLKGVPDETDHALVLKTVFGAQAGDKLMQEAKNRGAQLVFHREQLLLISKEAILVCPEAGLSPFQHVADLIPVFLMANDHLYASNADTSDFEQRLLNLLVNLIPSFEYSGPHAFSNAVARAHLMYGRFTDELKGDADYVDITAQFQKLVDLAPAEFMGLCFGLLSKYLNASPQSFVTNPNSLFLEDSYYQQTALSVDKIAKFRKEVSAKTDELKKIFEKRLTGPSDFTLFRAKPLYQTGANTFFCIDPGFLAEKMETGPFWRTLFAISAKEKKDALLAFWGRVFERYVNWLLSESVGSNNPRNVFFASPRYESDQSEVCDGLLLCGSDAVFMEYKGAVFTAQSKYGGSPQKLGAEIQDKLIQNPQGKRKGIEQLAESIRRTCRRKDADKIAGVDLAHIRRVFPLLIVRDGIGEAPMLNALLNHKFDGSPLLSFKTIRPRILTPLFCISADTLEYISAYLRDASLSDILDARYRGNKGMGGPFLAIDNEILDPLGDKRSEVLRQAFNEFTKTIVATLFPKEAALAELGGPDVVAKA